MLRQCVRMCVVFAAQPSIHKIVSLEHKLPVYYNDHRRFITLWTNLYNSLNLNHDPDARLKDLFTEELGISNEQCSEILNANNFLTKYSSQHIKNILYVCKEFKLSNETVLTHLKILDLSAETLYRKLKSIEKLNLKDISHGFPLVLIPDSKMERLLNYRLKDNFKRRLYFIADKLKRPPAVIAATTCNRIFVYKVDFNQLDAVLDILLEYGMSPDNIIKDWWVIRYKPEVIRERLEMSKKSGRKKLMPWMVKCPEPVFQRAMFITNNVQSELQGGKKPLKTYLAEKLECSQESVDEMCRTFPCLHKVRVCKIKQVHDFLLDQGFLKEDMVKAPKVFAHSIATIASRIEQMKAIGYKVTNLNNVCKSSKAFEQFLKVIKKQYAMTERNE